MHKTCIELLLPLVIVEKVCKYIPLFICFFVHPQCLRLCACAWAYIICLKILKVYAFEVAEREQIWCRFLPMPHMHDSVYVCVCMASLVECWWKLRAISNANFVWFLKLKDFNWILKHTSTRNASYARGAIFLSNI